MFKFSPINNLTNTTSVPVCSPEPVLEGGPEHPEAGGVSVGQPGVARRGAALLQLRVLWIPRDGLHSHLQQLL